MFGNRGTPAIRINDVIKKLILACACVSLFSGAAQATIVTNGNFATGDLTGWTVNNGGGSNPIVVIATDNVARGYPAGAYNEAIPPDTLTGGDPTLLGGAYGVYFVDDIAHQTLSQTVALAVGSYAIGFDVYVPYNGFNNPKDASFTGSIAGVELASFDVHSSAAGQWKEYSGIVNVLSAGNYLVTFDFTPGGYPAGDVVVDRAFIVGSDTPGTTDIGVPEPLTLSLFGAGLIGAASLRRRKTKSA